VRSIFVMTSSPSLGTAYQGEATSARSSDLVYEITNALWGDKARALDAGHAKGKMIRMETALTSPASPFHEPLS